MSQWCSLRPILYLGKTAERPESELWRGAQEELNKPIFRGMTLLQAYLGRFDEVNVRLERMLARRPKITSREDVTPAWLDATYLESAILADNRRATEVLLQRFADNTLSTSGNNWPTCIPRQLGGAAALLGRHGEARQHYHEAIRVCTEMRFRPELALTRLQLAELLLDHYPDEKNVALEHLDFAIKEFREMKMQPSLERALRRKEILKA